TTSTASAPLCPHSRRAGSPSIRGGVVRFGGSRGGRTPAGGVGGASLSTTSAGGVGAHLRSSREPDWRGRGASTPSQTAWALLAFHAAGVAGESVEKAVRWLVAAHG